MRALLTSAVVLSFAFSACGTSRTQSSISDSRDKSTTTSSHFRADADRDEDFKALEDDKRNDSTLNFGHEASKDDRQAITTLVKRYYTMAVARDGVSACAILDSNVAESVAGSYGYTSSGPAYLSSGRTCPAVMALLFTHFHERLSAELPALKVLRVRLVGISGLVVLGFGAMPERQLQVVREGHVWKITSIGDSELP